MKKVFCSLAVAVALTPMASRAQFSPAPDVGPPTKTTYIRLANNANAILVEPVTPDPVKSHIVIVVSHPEHVNNFNYFVARGMTRYGYRVMAINYYGPETSFYELLSPIAAGIKALRAMPGVDKVVLFGHSTGGAEVTQYQDVAENGPAACQRPERIYKCETKDAQNLPKADAMLLMDANSGGPERTSGINPAIDPRTPRSYNAAVDLFSAQNGYDPATGGANYSSAFLKTFFAAQAARANQMIDRATAQLSKIEKGQGDYSRDEQFVGEGQEVFSSATKPELAYIGLMSRTHGQHMLLKADGTRPVGIIPLVKEPQKRPASVPRLSPAPELETVRTYLSTHALRLTADYHWTADNIYGVQWNGSASSVQGSIQGIHVPTLVMSATCAPHLVLLEVAYDLSPAKDKEFVGVEGANHGFLPCKPEYGDTFARAFGYADAWLSKPGRL